MHKSDLVAAIADLTDMPLQHANEVVTVIVDEMTNALSRNESVNLMGFGSFSQRHRKARTGRSPKTGETIQISASTSVGFKPGKGLKAQINE